MSLETSEFNSNLTNSSLNKNDFDGETFVDVTVERKLNEGLKEMLNEDQINKVILENDKNLIVENLNYDDINCLYSDINYQNRKNPKNIILSNSLINNDENKRNIELSHESLNKINKQSIFKNEGGDQKPKKPWKQQLFQTQLFKQLTSQQLLSHHQHNQLPDNILINEDSDSDEPLLSGSGVVLKEFSDDVLEPWIDLVKKWKKLPFNQRPSGLKELIKYGIPQPMRGDIWNLLVRSDNDEALIETYRIMIKKESAFELNIKRDINRTFTANDYFKNSNSLGQDNLYKLCKAYSVFDEEIGYCQGLTFIGAALLLHMSEEQAFVVLVKIMHDCGMRNLFRCGFEELHLRFYQLNRLIEDQIPDLFHHFTKLGIETHMFASQWFLTLFTAKFPLHLVYYILDMFLYNKFNTIFQVSISLLNLSTSELLKLDFEGVLKYFRVYLPKKYQSDANAKYLLKTAMSYKFKKLEKYEKDYILYKESKQDPVERLTKENKRLQESNLRLEQENDYLAHDLVMSKISMRTQLDVTEDKIDNYSKELRKTKVYLNELEEEKKLLQSQVDSLKDLLRKELLQCESKINEKEKIYFQYKKNYSKLSKTLEEKELNFKEIKEKIMTCEHCRLFLQEDDLDNNLGKNGDEKIMIKEAKTSYKEYKINQYKSKIRELELELAQTKLALVESECNNQTLMHKLSSKD